MPKKDFFILYHKCLLVVVVLSLVVVTGLAQNPSVSEERAQYELEKRGIEEDEIRAKLLEKGIDPDDVDPTDPSALLSLERALEEAVRELEEEKEEEKEKEKMAKEIVEKMTQDTIVPQPQPDTENGEDEAAEESAVVDVNESLNLPEAEIYGQHIFRNKSIQLYNKSADIKPTDNYVLGVGDKVIISIWGKSQENAEYVIGAEGYIKPSKMPRIYLKGMTLAKARALLQSRYAEYYRFRPEEFEVIVNYARNITVNIVGEVFQYGSFTIPAINTAFNALVAAGGPTDIGSVRNIKLIRPGEQVRKIDIYEFLMNPSIAQDLYLQDNDIIHVEVADRVVNVEGAVKRPFKYELIKGENLRKLLEYAGGLKENAYKGNIQITRFVNDDTRIIDVDLNELDKSGRDFELLSGDQVMVNTIPKPVENYAEIIGAVEMPGKYEITRGMKVDELLKKGILVKEARTDIAFLLRTQKDNSIVYERVILDDILDNRNAASNVELQSRDRLLILSLSSFIDKDSVAVAGAVRIPTKIPFGSTKNIKVTDALTLAGGLRQDATNFAYIYRTDPGNIRQKEYLRIDLDAASANPDTPDNMILAPGDSIVVFSNLTYLDESFVKVSGAVRNPGSYKFDESLKLQDVLTMAGGTKLEADSSRIDIFSVIIENGVSTETLVKTLSVDKNFNNINDADFTLHPYDHIIVREVPEFEFQRFVRIEGEVKYPGAYALIDKNEKLWSIVERAGQLTDEAFLQGASLYRMEEGIGFIVMGLDEVKKNKKSRFNYILKEGDVITVPKQKDLVTITGAIKTRDIYPDKIARTGKINVAYHKGKNAKFYVDRYAAGVGERGRNRLITVEQANGAIERTKNFGFIKIYPQVRPGAIITVGTKKAKPEKEARQKEKVDWGRTIADSIAQATAILSLILLIQQVNR